MKPSEVVEKFVNRVDDPAGAAWMVRLHRDGAGVTLELGETTGHLFEFAFGGSRAGALASYLRAAREQDDSIHESVDSREGERVYVRITRTSRSQASVWRMMLSRQGGDVDGDRG